VFAGSAGTCTITISNSGFVATVSGAVTNFTPADLSFVAIPGFANSVAVSGDFAYVAAGASGLQVVGLSSDRVHPTVVGAVSLPGSSFDVNLVGNTAYVVGSSNLSVVDITNPLVPTLRGTFSTGNCLGVVVRGPTAYLNCSSGLQLINVNNPAAMIQISSLSVGGTPWKLAVDSTRNLVAMAMGTSGLKLVDISNPGAPALRGTAQTGDARAVVLNGNWAYVADYTTSTNSVDITLPNAPVVRSHILDHNLGGFLQDIATAGTFALAADVVFVNGIPITDISDPTNLQARAILSFTQRDDNGMGIAVDSSFVYLVTEHSSLNRGGSSGDSRLYIGQYLPRQDLAGVPPTVSITSPANGSTQYQGARLTVNANATDDVAVASVDFLVNALVAFTSTSTPYQYSFTIPTGINTLTVGARARDLGNNLSNTAQVVLNILPDPLTLVMGFVLDQNNSPVSGATVTAPGGLTGTTAANGSFSIPGVPTVLGNIQVNASFTPAGGSTLSGVSASVAPVLGGVTNVGTIQLIPASFNTNFGTNVSRCDDCFFQFTLPFAFPYYGVNRTSVFVGTNGYLTFNSGDNNYVESLPAFSSQARIAAFFDDLYPGPSPDPTSSLYVNSLPDRFLVTYLKDPHYPTSGPFNTLQIQLYPDGRIIFAYNGIGSLNTGTIVGLTPGPNTPSVAVDYITQTNVDVPAGSAVYEYFNETLLFNLDQSFIVFSPNAGGGYNVRTLPPNSAQQSGILTGSSGAQVQAQFRAAAASALVSLNTSQVANAEVIVHSSVDPKYVGMTNTDAGGNFLLTGVPIGGILVQVRRNGKVIAEGSGVFPNDTLTGNQVLPILLAPPAVSTKVTPQEN
jgi:hypothetical protein